MTDYFNISLLCVFSFPRCQHITKFLGKAFKPDQKSLNIQPRPRMIASEWVFRYLEIYVLLPCHQKILTLVVCWQGFMWITCLMTWLYANQESDYATHHGRSPRYVLKNWLTSEQRNIITHIIDFLSFFSSSKCWPYPPGLSNVCVCSSLFVSWFILCSSRNWLNLFLTTTLFIGVNPGRFSDSIAILSLSFEPICLLCNFWPTLIAGWFDWSCLTGTTTSLLLFPEKWNGNFCCSSTSKGNCCCSSTSKGNCCCCSTSKGRISCWTRSLGLPWLLMCGRTKSQILKASSFATWWGHVRSFRKSKLLIVMEEDPRF